MLTGRTLFEGKTAMAVCNHHMSTPAPSLAEHAECDLPDGLSELVSRCLSKSPGERPDTHSLLRALSDLLGDGGLAWDQKAAGRWWEAHGGDLRKDKAELAETLTGAVVAPRAELVGGSDETRPDRPNVIEAQA